MKRRQPPIWAFELLTEECERAGVKVPAIFWNRTDREQSHGNASPERGIRLYAGRDKKDQRFVLLHEIGHILVGEGHSHDAVFWDCAFALYKRHRLARYGLWREADYRHGAIKAAARAGVISDHVAKGLLALKIRTDLFARIKYVTDLNKAARR